MRQIMYSFCSPRNNLLQPLDSKPLSRIRNHYLKMTRNPGRVAGRHPVTSGGRSERRLRSPGSQARILTGHNAVTLLSESCNEESDYSFLVRDLLPSHDFPASTASTPRATRNSRRSQPPFAISMRPVGGSPGEAIGSEMAQTPRKLPI